MNNDLMFHCTIQTPLGDMMALADKRALYFLAWLDQPGIRERVKRLTMTTQTILTPGISRPLRTAQQELNDYFAGSLKVFTTPCALHGTPFQMKVWQELATIPYNQTWSYKKLAHTLGVPRGYRAVARANACNNISILIPCHRVIRSNGELSGYAGGQNRKKMLLAYECGTRKMIPYETVE